MKKKVTFEEFCTTMCRKNGRTFNILQLKALYNKAEVEEELKMLGKRITLARAQLNSLTTQRIRLEIKLSDIERRIVGARQMTDMEIAEKIFDELFKEEG